MTNSTPGTNAQGACLGLLLWCFVVGPVLILLAWNVGVAPLVNASGGNVEGIGYLVSVGATFALMLLRGVLR